MNKLFKYIWEKIGLKILPVIITLTIFTANGSADTRPKRIMSISPALTEILFGESCYDFGGITRPFND